jgi:anti-anti-sigma factor
MLNVQRRNLGTVSLLNLDGKLVIGETEYLRDVVQTLPSTTSVTLDLSNVTLVDAHGLGVLLHLREEAEARDMRFELMNVGYHLREVFRMTHLDSVFHMRAGVEFLRPAATAERTSVAA